MTHRHLVVVPHTHWDREWYRAHEEFRYQLVHLLDGLLELLERDPDFRHFTLDGQTVVLDDYLEVRPGARERIAKLVREGRLLVGPWYVLPDEWLVSGEALIRNLRLGLARAAEFGAGMRLGYVPDQFGHVGQLPQIFAGFGFEGAVLWRGVGADVDQTTFLWEAPDGTSLFAAYLVHGYANGGDLPREPEALAERLTREIAAQERWSRIPTLLVMNGGDHALPQPGLPRALELAAARLEGVTFELGTLPAYLRRARRHSPADLPRHRGELRSGLRAPLLEGCASARLPQKRAEFRNDRLLTRYLEPLASWLGALGGEGDPGIIELAWRIALKNHPHDSICGCSIDPVHEQMEARFARVAQLAGAHLRFVARELAGRVAAPARGPGRAGGESLLLWNPNGGGRAQAEGDVELDLGPGARRAPVLHVRDASGRRIPAHAQIVSTGATLSRFRFSASVVAALVRGFPAEFSGFCARGICWRETRAGLEVDVRVGTEPAQGVDWSAAKQAVVRELERRGSREVAMRIHRLPRVRLRFVDELPGHGLRVYRVGRGRAGGEELLAARTPKGGAIIANGSWRVEVAPDGTVCCRELRSGTEIADAVRLVSEGDRGDEYNFDPVPGGARIERPTTLRVRLLAPSEAEVAVAIDAHYRVPLELAPNRTRRSRRSASLRARIELRLARGLDRVHVAVEVDNTARDHRLRVHAGAPFAAERFEVESTFEVAERPIEPSPGSFGSERPAELPIGATPQRSFATLIGGGRALTVANRGSTEVEPVREAHGRSSLAVTVLRAVGWLSREDLHGRPAHAGPPLETPGAQVPGLHRAELAFFLHEPGDAARAAQAHAFATPALILPGPEAGEGPLADGDRLIEVEDSAVIVSAIEPRPESAPVVRLYNASPQARRLRVRWNGPGARSLEAVDLAGGALAEAELEAVDGASALLALRGWQIASLRPR